MAGEIETEGRKRSSSELLESRERLAELHELQAAMLTTPRAERKELKSKAEALDAEIKREEAQFNRLSEWDRAIANLRKADAEAGVVGEALCYLGSSVEQCGGGINIDEILLFYLIGATTDIVTAMQRHGDSATVISGGLHCLCALFGGLIRLENGEDVLKELAHLHVGEVVITGMSEHIAHREAQKCGCLVITNLALKMKGWTTDGLISEEESALWEATARAVVAKARRQHSDDAEVVAWAEQAMKHL